MDVLMVLHIWFCGRGDDEQRFTVLLEIYRSNVFFSKLICRSMLSSLLSLYMRLCIMAWINKEEQKGKRKGKKQQEILQIKCVEGIMCELAVRCCYPGV
jgi:hypothetical protein